MDYITVYEFTPRTSNLIHLLGILIFVILGFALVYYTKRSKMKFSLMRQFMIFFGYMLGGIASIMLIVTLIKVPKIVSYERELRETIENENFLVVVGEIEDFLDRPESEHIFESFTVKGIKFEYSDYISIDGFHQTSRNNGPIKNNGQQVRISYIKRNNVNCILKLELIP